MTDIKDHLHRVVKLAVDSGEASSIEEAESIFAGYQVQIAVGDDAATSPTMQAGILTAINSAHRTFLGGVSVSGCLDVPLAVPWRLCRSLRDAVEGLGGKVGKARCDVPLIAFGEPSGLARNEFAVQATFEGWNAGVIPLREGHRLEESRECVPAGVLAGGLAVAEAFQHVRGNPVAGRRESGLSLWRPDRDWRSADSGPLIQCLPSRLWLIGLGHLGQAILWTLGLLPYPLGNELELVLQDHDALVTANMSTSLLTFDRQIGMKKARAMAEWCEDRGFRTVIDERRFGESTRVTGDDPPVAVCGVDNPVARAALEDAGFGRIVEVGLGAGVHEYLAFQLHTFPGRCSARQKWGHITTSDAVPVEQPAYRDLKDRVDGCGIVELAGRTVGASFVGTVAATLVAAELLRMATGDHRYELIDGTLRCLDGRRAVLAEPRSAFNPGTMRVGHR